MGLIKRVDFFPSFSDYYLPRDEGTIGKMAKFFFEGTLFRWKDILDGLLFRPSWGERGSLKDDFLLITDNLLTGLSLIKSIIYLVFYLSYTSISVSNYSWSYVSLVCCFNTSKPLPKTNVGLGVNFNISSVKPACPGFNGESSGSGPLSITSILSSELSLNIIGLLAFSLYAFYILGTCMPLFFSTYYWYVLNFIFFNTFFLISGAFFAYSPSVCIRNISSLRGNGCIARKRRMS